MEKTPLLCTVNGNKRGLNPGTKMLVADMRNLEKHD